MTAALAEWERLERPLTEHTQRWSTIYGWPTKWPPAIKARAYQLAHRWPWMERQRLRTASHVPTGWPGPPPASP